LGKNQNLASPKTFDPLRYVEQYYEAEIRLVEILLQKRGKFFERNENNFA